MEKYLILVINPGSTSTKVAIFENEVKKFEETLIHSENELMQFNAIPDQLEFRKAAILTFLDAQKIQVRQLSAIVGRGGLFEPVVGGTYSINEKMLWDAREGKQGQHSSNLGCLLAYELAHKGEITAFVVDPVSVDEFEPLARYSGHSLIERRCLSHSLNIHMVSRWIAEKFMIPLDKSSFVVAHLGGGISIAPVKNGKIIDVNDATGAGPFSPDRTGTLPLQAFIELCFSGRYPKSTIKKMVMGEGGLKSYFGTANAKAIEERIQAGDKKASVIMEAMAYQIAKEIGAMATVLKGNIDAIILTGGLVKYERLLHWIEERIKFIAPIEIIPGEFEMEALASGGLRVLRGKEEAKKY